MKRVYVHQALEEKLPSHFIGTVKLYDKVLKIFNYYFCSFTFYYFNIK